MDPSRKKACRRSATCCRARERKALTGPGARRWRASRPDPDTFAFSLQMTRGPRDVARTSYDRRAAASAASLELGLHLRAASLVDDLASHGVAGIGQRVPRRRQRAAHAVRAFADHHFDRLSALAENADLDLLAGGREAHLDFLERVHARRRGGRAASRR